MVHTGNSTAKWADVKCNDCGIGGLDGGEQNAVTGEWLGTTPGLSGHPARASFGVRAYDVAVLSMARTRVEFTGLRGAGLQVCDGSRVSVDECHFVSNSVGIIVERDGHLGVTNSSFADNDMAAFLAGSFSEGATVRLENIAISGKIWLNRRRPGALTETQVGGPSANTTVTNESGWERAWRLEASTKDGLELEDDPYDATDVLQQGWRPEEAGAGVLRLMNQTKVGEFRHMYAWSRRQQDLFDPEVHELGVSWPPPVDEEYLLSESFQHQLTARGREEAEHSFWRGAGLPAGEIPAGPEEDVRRLCQEEEEEEEFT